MRQVGIDVEARPVQADPALEANADRADLVLAPFAILGPADPYADASGATLAAHIEMRERADHPFLDRRDEPADVGAAAPEVEHEIKHALPRAVIGELASAAGAVHREARVQQVFLVGAGPRGVEGRVLHQPDKLGAAAFGHGDGPRLHHRERLRIGNGRCADAPLDRPERRYGRDPHAGRIVRCISRVKHSSWVRTGSSALAASAATRFKMARSAARAKNFGEPVRLAIWAPSDLVAA